MTTTNIIEKRRKALEQRKNKLKQLEISLNAQERKKRTRRLIEIGGLAAKAKIEDWNANTLLGAFLFLKEMEREQERGYASGRNSKIIEEWTRKGGAAFAEEKEKQKSSPSKMKGSPVTVKFESDLSEEIKASLKSLGLKWNNLRKEWEGYANVEELKSLLKGKRAIVREL